MKAIKCDLCGKEIDSEAICMFPRYQIKKKINVVYCKKHCI